MVVDGNKVEEFDFESENRRQLAGNIYLAKVTRVEPSLQAAFVDYGGNRHGFLAFSEIHADYYQIPSCRPSRRCWLKNALLPRRRPHKDEDDQRSPSGRHARGRRRLVSKSQATRLSKRLTTQQRQPDINGMETL